MDVNSMVNNKVRHPAALSQTAKAILSDSWLGDEGGRRREEHGDYGVTRRGL